MGRVRPTPLVIAGVLLLGYLALTPPSHAQLIDGSTTELVTAIPLAAGATRAQLFVLNGVQEPVTATVELLDAAGSTLHWTAVEVQPSHHRSFHLAELHRGAPAASVRVTHEAGADALQSWLVLRRGVQTTELGLQSPGASTGTTLGSFWDRTGRERGAQPVFYLLNTTDSPVRFEVVSSEARRRNREAIPAHGVAAVRLASTGPSGWIEIHHDGPVGALVGAGVLTGAGELSPLPLGAPPNAPETSYVSIRVPVLEENGPLRPETVISLFNGADATCPVAIDVHDAQTGHLLHRVERSLEPREVASIELAALLGRAAAPDGPEVRVRVQAPRPGLQVTGFTRMSSGAVLDLAFFDESTAHGSGHYPLPSLEDNDVFLTVVNVGAEDAEVVAQLFWDEGWTYSFGPLPVPSGASRRIDVRQIAAEAVPDVLGRTLDPHYAGGMLKWKVFEGQPTFVARTEVRPLGTEDTFGFNCFGCCWEIPWGSIEPSNVSFFLNESPLFQTCVTWDTCSGTMGPYPITGSTLFLVSPFSWDGKNVSANDPAQEALSFEDWKQKVSATCQFLLKKITGFGTPSTCKHLLRKVDKPWQTWNETGLCHPQAVGESNPCLACKQCCESIRAWKVCTKYSLIHANSEYTACLEQCEIEICEA